MLAILTLLFMSYGVITDAVRMEISSEAPSRADAVVVLAGDNGWRLGKGLELVGDDVSDVLVHVGKPMTMVHPPCQRTLRFEGICLIPIPDKTRTEAQVVAALARSRGWDSMAVVTSSAHLSRAALLFRRCFDGEVSLVEAPKDLAAHPPLDAEIRAFVDEAGGLIHAFLNRKC